MGYSSSNVGTVLSDELVGMERQSYDSCKDLFLHLVGQEETIQSPPQDSWILAQESDSENTS